VDLPGPAAASPRATVARLPLGPGVYRFRDAAGRILYVGRAVCLRRRVQSYWGDLGDRGHLAPMVARIARVEAVICDSAHDAAWLERNLLQRRLPPWNRQDDADVYGWAAGVLVRFEIRGGRMSGWRQRPCAAAAARRYLDQSPPGWTPFASREAELAARLRACPPGTCAG
jgi:hypothetical protein